MRKVVLGLMMAGTLLPGLAAAQDDRRPDSPRGRAEQRGEPRGPGGFRGEGRPQPQAQSATQAQPAPQPQAQQRPSFDGGDRRGFRGGLGGDARRFQPQPGQPPQDRAAVERRDSRGDRFAPDQRFDRDRFEGRPPVAPGSGGYRPQGGPPVAPGSGGYRPQPGQFGYRPGGPGGSGYRPAPPAPGRGGGWNRGWRDDRRFDFRSYRVQNNYLFRLPRYRAPYGWGYGYRRFSPGFTLSTVLFDEGYWIDDPYTYRLPPVWGPYRWVRYYNDALLVDVRTGIVVDTAYDIFW